MTTFLPDDIVLQGREVTLRPLLPEDAGALAAASGESREHYLYNPVPDGLREAREAIARALRMRAEGLRLPFAVIFGGRLVGTTSYSEYQPWQWPVASELQRVDRPDAVEIGYTWLAASAQRTACNTEAKLLLMQHAFDIWQVHSVSLRTDERNARSRRAIERLGCHFDGLRRAHMPGSDGTLRTSAFYSVIAAEWPGVRARLLQRLARR